jgi:hypothetical protein
MDAREEQRSLNDCPLPQTVIINPLTRVWDIDGQIALLQDQIKDLMQKRTEALDYAIKEQIAEDENCRLDVKAGRIVRTINPDKFREVFPDQYAIIKQLEIDDLNLKITHAGEKVSVSVADKLIKPVILNAAQGVVATTQAPDQYMVVKKQ